MKLMERVLDSLIDIHNVARGCSRTRLYPIKYLFLVENRFLRKLRFRFACVRYGILITLSLSHFLISSASDYLASLKSSCLYSYELNPIKL